MKTEEIKSTVMVPGTMFAQVEHGKIVNFTFTPAAADAGYFGDEITVWDGDNIEADQFFDMVSQMLNIAQDRKSAFFACEWKS